MPEKQLDIFVFGCKCFDILEVFHKFTLLLQREIKLKVTMSDLWSLK